MFFTRAIAEKMVDTIMKQTPNAVSTKSQTVRFFVCVCLKHV